MQNTLLVSIIMPCFNSAKTINDAVKSVLNQTYENWELLIIDDCSTDETPRILREIKEKDSRIKIFRTQENSGSPAKARNIGVEFSIGDLIAFLDSDDVWSKKKLEIQLEYFDNRNIAIVFSDYEKISSDGKSSGRLVKAPAILDYYQLLKGNVIGCSTVVIDIRLTGKLFFHDVRHEDFDLWLSILKNGFRARNAGFNLVKYRISQSSISSNKLKAFFWAYRIIYRQENLNFLTKNVYALNLACKAFIKYLK